MRALTARQLEVLELLSKGLTNAEIASVLGIAASTVKRHVEAILQALEVSNRTEAASAYHELHGGTAAAAGADAAHRVSGFGDRPALAVLPFDSIGGDPGDAYLADAIARGLVDALSSWRWFPVIASASSFVYRGAPVDLRQVSRELGVRYVVQGDVRFADAQVRVSARLVDATSGEQLLACRHEAERSQSFVLEDELAERLMVAIEPALERVEWRRAAERASADPSAYECVQRGYFYGTRRTREDLVRARALFREAIEKDPDYVPAHVALSGSHLFEVLYLWSESIPDSIAAALRSARRAVALDPQDFLAQQVLGGALALAGEAEASIAAYERALALNPSAPLACWGLGTALRRRGRLDECIELLERAVRLSPRDALINLFLITLGTAYLLAGRYEDAVARAEDALRNEPDDPQAYDVLSAAYGLLGQLDQARAAAKRLLELRPFSLEMVKLLNPPEVVACLVEGWRRAGVPGLDREEAPSAG